MCHLTFWQCGDILVACQTLGIVNDEPGRLNMNSLTNQELIEAYVSANEMGDTYGEYVFGQEIVRRGIDGSSNAGEI